MSNPHLDNLNPEQLQAVQHTDGPLLIFAGAGSGKTRVLTRRIANLLLSGSVHPAEIFAVTFTNKAAREMKERVSSLLPGISSNLWVSTFHSSCSRILRRHAELLDYTPRFAIYDSADSLSLLKKVYRQLGIDPRALDPRSVRRKIDRAKNTYRFAESYREESDDTQPWSGAFADIYECYQSELHRANAMDFGDLICNVVTLFTLERKLLEQYQQRFRYLLVDEYQDTNKVQYMLIQMLSEPQRNLCVVGDDDQSIYAFRGASVQNILSFNEDYPDAKIITLEQNYRSTGTILEAANAVIAKNRKRRPKKMRTENAAGESITSYCAVDEKDEAKFVVREISNLLESGLAPSEIAVFYRTNAQSRAVEEALCAQGVPYDMYGGFRFYERKEIKDILAYFRLLLNPQDNEAFLRIVNTPTRGLGTTAVAALIAHAAEKRLPLLQALGEALAAEASFMRASAKKRFQAFHNLIERLSAEAEAAEELLSGTASNSGNVSCGELRQTLAGLLKRIADESGYMAHLRKQDTPESESKRENILELCSVAVDFVEQALQEEEIPSLQQFLDRTSLISDLDKENTASGEADSKYQSHGHVSLMTLHLAKGLEFDAAFLIGLEEGLLPHSRSYESRSGLEEERRLCYVGITRARKLLYLSRALERHHFGSGQYHAGGQASRFLADIPSHLCFERTSSLMSGSSELHAEDAYETWEANE